MPLKGSPQQISCLLGWIPSPLRSPWKLASLDLFPGLSHPNALLWILCSRSQVTLGAQGGVFITNTSAVRLPGLPPTPRPGPQRVRGPCPTLPAASFPFHSSDRYPAPTHQQFQLGALHWGWGVLKRGKTSLPTLGWKNQRGSIPEERGGSGSLQRGSRDSSPWETETPETRQEPGRRPQRWGRGSRET